VRKLTTGLFGAALVALVVVPAGPASAATVGSDARVTQHTYVRHDGGTDPTIEGCNNLTPAGDENLAGNFRQKNEPFSVVDPQNPDIVIAGWNDYCSDWMGLGFSVDGGQTWTNSLVPGYPADTSIEGMQSPEFIRTNTASDPVGAFDTHGHFYFGFLAFNGNAGHKTNSDVAVARYDVVDPETNDDNPLDYIGTARLATGPAASNFFGVFNDKNMIEVDRTGGSHDGSVYMCWTKFVGLAPSTTILFARSTDGGATFSHPIGISGNTSGQGCDIAVEADGDVYVDWRDFAGNSSHQTFGVSAVRSGDGGQTFGKVVKVGALDAYNPFDTARDCGDGVDACPSGFVFHRVPLEPRITSDPTGRLAGVFAIYNAVDPATTVASTTSYSSAGSGGSGLVGQSKVYVARSLDNGQTWTPYLVANNSVGHQYFPDGDALAGQLAVVWQDSRVDNDYSIQRPVGNLANATSSGTDALSTFVAVSTNGTSFGAPQEVASVRQQPQYEMFDAASVPFLGDYNWIQMVDAGGGSLFGYLTWTDNRDVVPGTDPREATQDGFDTEGCWVVDPAAAGGFRRTCLNGGGYNQNIYGNSITIP
jgi:hypothetical protein